eukprot:scpid10939/ scgid17044/ Cancer-related nucleoside-triphosphatase homolog; Nucleoside triphosphate phosphohydrolase
MASHSALGPSLTRKSHVFLTGRPGVGKTTAIRRIVELLQNEKKPQGDGGGGIDGFYTQERRERSRRVGFDVVTLNGERQSLADVMPDAPDPSRRRPRYVVGRYGVNLEKFERSVLPILRQYVDKSSSHAHGQVLIVDEIGKMEAFSKEFLTNTRQILESNFVEPSVNVVGTVPSAGGHFSRELQALLKLIESHPACAVLEVTEENRQRIPARVVAMLQGDGSV